MNLLSPREVAVRLNVSLRLAYELIGTEIPCVRVRSLKRVREEDLAAYIAGGGSCRSAGISGVDFTSALCTGTGASTERFRREQPSKTLTRSQRRP